MRFHFKITLIILLMFFFIPSDSFGSTDGIMAQRRVLLDRHQKQTNSGNQRDRLPNDVELFVLYNNLDQTLEVVSDNDFEGTVFITTESGYMMDYSSQLNVIFDTSKYDTGTYLIHITSDYWEADGEVYVYNE